MSANFKIGDKVKITGNSTGSVNSIGDIGVITELRGHQCRVQVDGGASTINWSSLSEIESVSVTEINRGDWVFYTGTTIGETLRFVMDIKGDQLYFAENKNIIDPLNSNNKKHYRKATEKEILEMADPIVSGFITTSTPEYKWNEWHGHGLILNEGQTITMRDNYSNTTEYINSQINNNQNGSNKESGSKESQGVSISDGRRETIIRHEVSFGGRGNGLETGNRERKIRSVEIGKRSGHEGKGLCIGRRPKRSTSI